jgi:hypothetical protein
MTKRATNGLNAKEAKLLGSVFLRPGKPSPKTIAEMAEIVWPEKAKAKANSWVRNSLRKIVKLGILEPVEPGTYDFTPEGRELAKLAVVDAPQTPGPKPKGKAKKPAEPDTFTALAVQVFQAAPEAVVEAPVVAPATSTPEAAPAPAPASIIAPEPTVDEVDAILADVAPVAEPTAASIMAAAAV